MLSDVDENCSMRKKKRKPVDLEAVETTIEKELNEGTNGTVVQEALE